MYSTSFSEWIFLRIVGQALYNFYMYTTYISADLAHREIFHAKVGKGVIN